MMEKSEPNISLNFSLSELREIVEICHAAGCAYPMDGKGSPMTDKDGNVLMSIPMVDGNGVVIMESQPLPFRYRFEDDKWKDIYDRLYEALEEMDPFIGF